MALEQLHLHINSHEQPPSRHPLRAGHTNQPIPDIIGKITLIGSFVVLVLGHWLGMAQAIALQDVI
jgi:hypothetical protein